MKKEKKEEKIKLPEVQEKKEIVSLNPELYSDLSIEELEERLEMGCYINVCGCDDNSCSCNVDVSVCNCDANTGCNTLVCGALLCLDAG